MLLTTDQNLRSQQSLTGWRIPILVLPTTSWPEISRHEAEVLPALNTILASEYRELQW